MSQKPKMVKTGLFSSIQRLSPSSSFKIEGKICQRNLTRIDRAIQKCCAARIGLVVSDNGAWVASGVSENPHSARSSPFQRKAF